MTPIGKSEQTISEHLQDMLNDPVLLDEMTGYQIIAVKKAIKLLAEDNNVPVKQPDPITGLVPCGCGGVTEQTDFHDGFFPYSKVECLECGNEIMRAGNTASESHSEAKRAWNASHGYTAPPRPSAMEVEK